MPKIADDQIVAGIGPTNTLPKFAPTTGNLVASRLSDTGSVISIPGRTVNVGDVAQANNGTSIALNDLNKAVLIRAGKSATSRASLDMDGEDAGQAILTAIEGSLNATLFLQPQASLITVGFTPVDSGRINLKAGIIDLLTPSLRKNGAPLGVVFSTALEDQADSITATELTVDGAATPAGLYRLSYYLVATVAGTSGTVKATFIWTDPGDTRIVDSAVITFGTLAAPASGTLIMRNTGVLTMTFSTTVTEAVGSPEYALYITMERLQ